LDKYKCKICEKTFEDYETATEHTLTHTKEEMVKYAIETIFASAMLKGLISMEPDYSHRYHR
jgi:hypothetical protein